MPTAIVTALALPHGIGPSGARRVSVFLTPRLESDGGEQLELFPAMLDWPAAIGHPDVGFVVEVDGHGAITTRIVSARPSSQRWRSLFRPGHQVARAPGIGTDERVLVTYPYAGLAGDLERRYGEIGAASVTRPPSRPQVLFALDDLMHVARRGLRGAQTSGEHLSELLERAEERVARRREQRRADPTFDGGSPVVLGDEEPAGLSRDLVQFEAFHHELLAARVPREKPHVDFHKAVAALGDHPWLLRELGLVVDLELLGIPFASPAADPRRLRVVPSWNGHEPEGVEVVSRWVGYTAGPTSFRTADRPGRGPEESLVDGLVSIGEGGWDLVQVDVDGGFLKLLGAAATAADRADEATGRGRPVIGVEALPALRSGGLTLARRSSALALDRSMGDQRRLAAADVDDDESTLFAADVTRGYRMDIREQRTGAWRSLLARVVQATVDGEPALPLVHDEGVLRRGVRHATPPNPSRPAPAPTYVHDALGRWDGWSLAAPHPGLAMSKDGRAPDDHHPETLPVESRNPPVADGVPLSIEPRAEPGSLPRLRYGGRYHVRLRAVDLAGNGPSLAEADVVTAADDGHRLVLPADDAGLLVVRYEPVGSPQLVCREVVGPGESLAHLVIRSDAGADVGAAQWAETNGVGGATCERHVVPPKVSQLQAERHGAFDAAIGTGATAADTYELARREKGQLHHAAARMRDGSTRHRRTRLDETPAGQYVIDPDQDLVIPYLPDPVADAVTVFGAPGTTPGTLVRMDGDGSSSGPTPAPLDAGTTPEALLRVGFGDPDLWPDLLPFRLVLAEGDAPPRWDPVVRALVLSLPPGGRARIELSCAPSRAHLDELAPRAWARARHPDAALVALAEAGRVWQISPARHLELVHAVQRPVRTPVIDQLVASRSPADTSVVLTGTIGVHGATSERLDLEATWEEPAGWGSDSSSRQRHAHVFEQPLHVSYDPMPDDLTTPPTELDAIKYEEASDRVRLTTPPPRVPGEKVQPARTPRHELGDTRHRMVSYQAVATSRFREYLPEPVWTDPVNVTQRSVPFVVDVPSSAVPLAPSVVQVLPTFAWQHDVPEGFGTQSVRRGGGLRIYLEPPWFSSGEGELLGVVYRTGDESGVRNDRMTRWGMDPIWDGGTPTRWPTLAHAVDAAATARGLRLGPDGAQVDVAGYPVAWDDERKLWSSDVALDVSRSHTPFVRLALVRWQPHSLPGLELSPLVLAELVQPAPDRVLTILRSSPDPLGGFTGDGSPPDLSDPQPQPMSVRLLLAGPGPLTRTTVTVQRRMIGTRDEVGWVDASGPGITVAPMDPPAGSAAHWAASVSFDDVNAARFRLLVRESEVFPDGRDRPLFLETVQP
jgi:hypothetical protein